MTRGNKGGAATPVLRAIVTTMALDVLLVGALFVPAGRLDWPMGWAFVGFLVGFAVVGFIVLPSELIGERSRRHPDARPVDLVLAGLAFMFLYPATLVVCGLDFRFAWSPTVLGPVQWLSFGILAAGYGFSLWAARSNPFFSTVVRIQRERDHYVIARGPYAFVRHPGYAGPLIGHLVLPVALGSLWGLIPAAAGVGFLVLRTVYEDRTLATELEGYRDYIQRVRWRLIPRVW
jgi:protein-S-isoprenylcysteine O-methyltransferase Ste14